MQSEKENSGSLKDRFEGFGAVPTEGLWGRIESELEEKKKRRGIVWWWFGGLAAVLAISFLMYEIGYRQGASNLDSQIVQEVEEQESQGDEVQNNNTEEMDAVETLPDQFENKEHSDEVPGDKVNTEEKKYVDEYEKVPAYALENDQLNIAITETHIQQSHLSDDKRNEDISKMALTGIHPLKLELGLPSIELADHLITEIEKPEEDPKNWYYGFNLRGQTYLDKRFVYYDLYSPSAGLTSYDTGGSNTVNNSGTVQMESLSTSPQVIESFMSKPLSLELIVGKYISKRWSWQTGLEGSRAVYHTYYDNSTLQFARTVVWSVGVPLKINCDLVSKPRRKWSVGGGLINELPLVESVTESTYTESSKFSKFKMGYMGALQFDTGLSFKLGNKMWLDISPSYRWYFAQTFGSDYPLARKNHWLSGSIGLIWDL